MEEIVKVCKTHGPLTAENVGIVRRKDRPAGSIYLKCKLCNRASAGSARSEKRRLYREGLADIPCSANVKARQDRVENPDKHREWGRRHREKLGDLRNPMEIARRAGISLEEYQSEYESQNGLCKACGSPETRVQKGKVTRLGLRICPFTKEPKGFLCNSCSTAIGGFQHSVDIIRSAIDYLKGGADAK